MLNAKRYTADKNNQMHEPPSGWHQHNEFARLISERVVFYSAAILLPSMMAAGFLYYPDKMKDIFSKIASPEGIGLLILIQACYFVLHEFIHLLVMPTSNTCGQRYYLQDKFKLAVFFNGEMSIRRYKIMLLSPFLFFNLLFLFVFLNTTGIFNTLALILFIVHFGACVFDIAIFLKLTGKKYAQYTSIYSAPSGMYFK